MNILCSPSPQILLPEIIILFKPNNDGLENACKTFSSKLFMNTVPGVMAVVFQGSGSVVFNSDLDKEF